MNDHRLGVGNTPLIAITALAAAGARVLAKCEFLNPTGSHKDRVYALMLPQLEAAGRIHAGMRLVDSSTGNGGAALARSASLLGYRATIVMPEGMTEERLSQIRAWGAEIVETPSARFLSGADERARQIADADPAAYYLNQSASPLNRLALRAAGREIVEQCGRDVAVDSFVCSLGTGGTFSGIAMELVRAYPGMRKVAIEVDRSAPLYAKRRGAPFAHCTHNLMGLGPGLIADNVLEDLVDEVITISGDRAWQMKERILREEGLAVGPTAAANLAIALEEARRLGPGGTVVTVFFDAGWKYGSIPHGRYELYPPFPSPPQTSTARQ